MTWESKCGQYRVQEAQNKYDGITRYYALVLVDDKWRMTEHMKPYKTRKAAETAILKYSGVVPEKKITKKRKVKR